MSKTKKKSVNRAHTRRFKIPKRPLLRMWLRLQNTAFSIWQRIYNAKLRYKLIGLAVLLVVAEAINIIQPILAERAYAIGNAESLLVEKSEVMASKISYDEKEGAYVFTGGATSSAEALENGKTAVTSTVHKDAKKGVEITDTINQVSFKMIPAFSTNVGRQDGNRIVFPLTNGQSGWLVYSVQGTGIKEDILLNSTGSSELTFEYTLDLGSKLEARMETDGSIGIYGNTLFSSNIATSTDADAALLEKARQNATKTTYLFGIPAPTITESQNESSNVVANYELSGSSLKLHVSNLKAGRYPLSIDPSIYVVTAQQFMAGNNETNINFDVDNKLIKKGRTTGARFNSWTTTSNLPTGEWYGASVGAGGYLYTVGGTAFNGQIFSSQGSGAFTVPSGVTSLTLKMWGGGGGGGGGGSNAAGGAGGGGGYTTATITVTPGETLDVYVGGGGGAGTGFNNNSGYGGGGGGASTVYRSSTPLAIAAGGGGGGGGDSTGGQTGGAGGAGGGDTGGNGGAAGGSGSVNNGGNGGTQSAGGTLGSGGTNPGVIGSSLTGGSGGNGQNSTSGSKGGAANGGLLNGGDGGSRITSSYPGGGGGGAGYFGGAGGNGANTTRGGSGGGGGSSYYTGTGANTAGTGITPGNSTDSYRNGAADGGAAGPADANGTAGDSGLIVVTYSGGLAASQSVNWAKFNTGSGTIDSANPGTGACSGWCTTSAYNLPGARSNFSLVAYNGFLYAMGGLDGSNARQSTVYVAKIGANGEPQLWHPTDSNKANWVYWYTDSGLSSTRSSFGAVAYNNRMYVVGGLTGAGAGTAVNTTQIANINPNGTLGSWATSTTLSSPTYGHDVQVYNDRLYVIGGSNSIGGAPSTSIVYNKINNDGSLNSWQPTTPLLNGRMQSGGNFSTIWGAYIYVSGGCGTVNANGYCTNIRSDTQVASINADGSIDVWNTVGGVTDQRMGHSLIAWRDNIYEIGGCDIVSATTGECDILNGLLDTINYGVINPDGEASTVADSVANTLAPCSTLFKGCNLPGVSYIGNVLTGSAIMNGYLYIWGGCSNTNSGCSSVSRGVIYTAIGSDGSLTRPASCGSWSVVDSYCYNTTSLPAGFAAPGTAVANGYIYSVGGFNVGGMAGNIYRAAPNPTNGSISSWTATDLTTIGATDVSYTYSFARANPSQAGSVPNNLYIVGGCIGATGVGCPSIGGYTQRVYKCNLDTAGAPSACVWNTQLQIGTVPGADSAGLGAMAGTVYANYIYLMGGLAEGATDLKTTRYAKIDDNNDIVAVSGSAWVESPNQTFYGRRRGSGFGYNGYLYVVGGFDGTGGGSVLADIEFAKINVSDGSIGAWTVSTVSINQRWGLTLTVSNSFAYVIGGCVNGDAPTCASGGQTNSLQTFQVYNNDSGAPAAYSTSANTYGTNPNRIGVSGAISNGYMYVAGGCTGTTDCTSPVTTVSSSPIDVYGGLGSWTNTTALPAARAWGKLLTAGGSLYYIGGQDADGVSQSTVYWATPSGGTISSWSTATNGLPASRTQFGATVWNNRLYVVGGNTGAANQIIYSTAGTSTFTVPTGVTSITVKAWGGGGSGGNGSSGTGSGGNGGGGGFAQADITVTPGESLTLNVGNGGSKATTASYGGNGGGFSAVLRSGTYLIQAGGGGGGGGTNGTAIAGGVGGPGGGTTAAAGNGTAGGGTTGGGLGGGGITPGGAAGTAGTTGSAGNTGAANLGGDAGGSGATCATVVATRGGNGGTGGGGKGGSSATCVGGGGGGGGAFGGGGGGSAATPTRGGGGGGGGSSLVTGSNTVRTVATLQTPGNNTDSTRVTTVGVGGNGSTSTASTAGGSGELVISYSTYTPTATVYVSPQLNSGGNITSAWSTSSTSFDVARSNLTAVAYANNLYILGGHDGANYLSDTQYAQIDSGATVPTNAGLVTGSWTYSESLPKPMAGGDGFATNGYIYLVGGRTDDTTCTPVTLVAPISANTTIATGNNPTGVGVWYETNQRYTGARYGNATVYNDGKAYVIGGGCGVQTTYASPTIQQTTLLTQPQVAKYSIMFDTDSDVYPNAWLLNGVDNSIGARWQLKYRSMTNPSAAVQCAASGVMSTWGQETNHGNVTLMLPGAYTPKDASGTNTNCARYFYFSISVDSSQAFGYPDDVSRGPTITDLTLQFTADPAKRLMHGRTFVGGLQMPDDTPYYAH